MKYRTLGTGLQVSALGLGCMPMVGTGAVHYGRANADECIATIHRAIDLGVTFFDTAAVYGPFTNETLLGRAIKGRRDGLVVATKCGFRTNADGVSVMDSTPATVRAVCEGSLRRLGIDVIDLFYQHRVDRGVPIEDTVGALAELVKEGKVRWLGLSEAGAATLRRAAAVHPIAALQSEYSLWERHVEAEILPVARELGIGFVPYSPLGRGFLTGRIRHRSDLADGDYRTQDPRFAADNLPRNLAILETVAAIARAHEATALHGAGVDAGEGRRWPHRCLFDGRDIVLHPQWPTAIHGQHAVGTGATQLRIARSARQVCPGATDVSAL